jgi:hypothetical protein
MCHTCARPLLRARGYRAAGLFGLLSLADLLLTAWLLTRPEQGVYEANPVASELLTRWGWPGVIALKLAAVLLAGGVAVFLSRRRPRAGLGILTFGCAITGAVVLYSGCLAATLEDSDALAPHELLLGEQSELLALKLAPDAGIPRAARPDRGRAERLPGHPVRRDLSPGDHRPGPGPELGAATAVQLPG